jgi:hypothetical protein
MKVISQTHTHTNTCYVCPLSLRHGAPSFYGWRRRPPGQLRIHSHLCVRSACQEIKEPDLTFHVQNLISACPCFSSSEESVQHRLQSSVTRFFTVRSQPSPSNQILRPQLFGSPWLLIKQRIGRAMDQASHRPLTAEARVRGRVCQRGICDGQSGTGTEFYPTSSVFPCHYHSTISLYTHVSPGGVTICPSVAAVQRHRLTPSSSAKAATSSVLRTLTHCLGLGQIACICGSRRRWI